MTLRGRSVAVAGALLLLGIGTTAWASKGKTTRTPAEKCTVQKLRAAARFEVCLLAAQANVVGTSAAPDTSTCDSDIATKWQKIESKAAGACPVGTGDLASVLDQVSSSASSLSAAIVPSH